MEIEKIIVHEDYCDENSDGHDIALLKLKEKVDLSRFTPACLPPKNASYAGKTASVYGWGQTQTKDNALPIDEGCPRYGNSPVLMEATQTIMTNNACEKSSGTVQVCENGLITEVEVTMAGQLTKDMVCGIGNRQSACKGDSGGPFTVEVGGQHILVGAVSWGLGCGRVSIIAIDHELEIICIKNTLQGLPTVYSSVPAQRDWINTTIENNGGAKYCD